MARNPGAAAASGGMILGWCSSRPFALFTLVIIFVKF